MVALILPVTGYTGTSSWAQHQRRNPRSSEPGTDFYVPHGTPVYAPAAGRIYGAGWDINQPAGRWVGIDLDNGMGFRCLHHADLVRTSGRVEQGDLIAYSGASGYGSEFFGEPSRNAAFWRNTGGDHTHVTLWPTHVKRFGYGSDGRPFTIDFMAHVGGVLAGSGSTPFEEDDMFSEADRQKLDDIFGAIGAGNGRVLPAQNSVLAHVRASVTLSNAILSLLAPVQRLQNGEPVSVSLRQEIADAKTGVLELLGRPVSDVTFDVDEDALADALAPLLTENLGKVSEIDLARIAQAAADEQDRRARERLNS